MKFAALCVSLLIPLGAYAQSDLAETALSQQILPGFAVLEQQGAKLAQAAAQDCPGNDAAVRAAYHATFDAWMGVNHLRFGPTETDGRAFALAFWPDSRGKTPKALGGLIRNQDPIVHSAKGYADVSIAARGLYALEFMVFDETLSQQGDAQYRCALIAAIGSDIAAITQAMNHDWQNGYADALRSPRAEGRYQSQDEVKRELFKALATGLELASDVRLARPLGSYDKPRPRRAEAWRSQRSLHNIELSLAALRDLALILAAPYPEIETRLTARFERALSYAAGLDDPALAGVATPQGRIRVEALRQHVEDARAIVLTELGPALGVDAGFNSLDGD